MDFSKLAILLTGSLVAPKNSNRFDEREMRSFLEDKRRTTF